MSCNLMSLPWMIFDFDQCHFTDIYCLRRLARHKNITVNQTVVMRRQK